MSKSKRSYTASHVTTFPKSAQLCSHAPSGFCTLLLQHCLISAEGTATAQCTKGGLSFARTIIGHQAPSISHGDIQTRDLGSNCRFPQGGISLILDNVLFGISSRTVHAGRDSATWRDLSIPWGLNNVQPPTRSTRLSSSTDGALPCDIADTGSLSSSRRSVK